MCSGSGHFGIFGRRVRHALKVDKIFVGSSAVQRPVRPLVVVEELVLGEPWRDAGDGGGGPSYRFQNSMRAERLARSKSAMNSEPPSTWMDSTGNGMASAMARRKQAALPAAPSPSGQFMELASGEEIPKCF